MCNKSHIKRSSILADNFYPFLVAGVARYIPFQQETQCGELYNIAEHLTIIISGILLCIGIHFHAHNYTVHRIQVLIMKVSELGGLHWACAPYK